MNRPPRLRIVVVGLGHHGTQLAHQVVARDFELIAAVESDGRAGVDLNSIIPGSADGAIVHESPEEAAAVGADVAILAAAFPTSVAVDIAKSFMQAGVNVLTLSAEMFDPHQAWRSELDDIGRRTGASLLATGVQDTWWVQMPAVAAGASSEISRIAIEHQVDLNSLSAGVANFIGVGQAAAEHDVRGVEYEPGGEDTVLVPALHEAARRMGLVPTQTTVWHVPVVATKTTPWRQAGTEVEPGLVIGVEERSLVETNTPVVFAGSLRTLLLDDDEVPYDRIVIEGVPVLVLEHKPFPGEVITNISLLNRIPDVVSAPGGVLGASQLAPARAASPASPS